MNMNKKYYQCLMPSDKELLQIFPEAKEIIPEKINEWYENREQIANEIKERLITIRNITNDDFERWFLKELFIKLDFGDKLLEADKQLSRLYNLRKITQGVNTGSRIADTDIQNALAVPIVDLVSNQVELRRSGKNFIALCPFHTEKHPSFVVYPDTNSCWCYGCQKGGNTIKFTMQFYDYSFKEAIRWLNGGQL